MDNKIAHKRCMLLWLSVVLEEHELTNLQRGRDELDLFTIVFTIHLSLNLFYKIIIVTFFPFESCTGHLLGICIGNHTVSSSIWN